jgi:hypothetical protein
VQEGEYLAVFLLTFKLDIIFELFDPGVTRLFSRIETILE